MFGPRALVLSVLASIAPSQSESGAAPPTQTLDQVQRAMLTAQVELRWLLDRVAQLERELADQRAAAARDLAAAHQQAENDRARAESTSREQQAGHQRERNTWRTKLEAARQQTELARRELERSHNDTAALRAQRDEADAKNARERQELRDATRALAGEFADLQTAWTEREATAGTPPAAAAPAQPPRSALERRCTPARSTIIESRRATPPAEAATTDEAVPAPMPATGARTPRRRGKLD